MAPTDNSIDEPPVLIDGSRVVEYATLVARPGAGRVSAVVEGVTLDLDTVSRLVVAEDFVGGGVFLMHCNREWETIAAGHHGDAESARASADEAYADVTVKWTTYRPLTATEQREVETTRDFLREIAAEFPDER